MALKLSIIVSMYNKKQKTIEVIDKLFFPSLIRNVSKEMELILIDDKSPLNKETDKLVRKYRGQLKKKLKSFIYLKNKKNLGFSKSYNRGIMLAKSEAILVTNDDVYFTKDSIKRLYKVAVENKMAGVIGPVTNYAASFQNTRLFKKLLSYSSEELNRIESFARLLRKLMKDKTYSVNKLIGFCGIYKKSILNKTGYFDSRVPDFEDDDLNFRVQKKGYSLMLAADIFVEHGGIEGGSVSMSQNKIKTYRDYLLSSIRFGLINRIFFRAMLRTLITNYIQIKDYGFTITSEIKSQSKKKGIPIKF